MGRGRGGALHSKGNNSSLHLVYWLPRKPIMKAGEQTVPQWRCLLHSDHLQVEGQIPSGLLFLPTTKGCVTSPRLAEHL